jgi:hypothetical protein
VYFWIFVGKVLVEVSHEGFLVLVVHEPEHDFHAEVLGLFAFDDQKLLDDVLDDELDFAFVRGLLVEVLEENFGGEDLALGVGVCNAVNDDSLMFTKCVMVFIGYNFEQFVHGLFLDFEDFGEDAFGDGEGFGFGLDFGGIEV